MFAGAMLVVALLLLVGGTANDYRKQVLLRGKRERMDKDFYEANEHLQKYFPQRAKRMREAYEFQKKDHL